MWTFAATSTIGSSHEKRGLPCQDSHAVSVVLAGGDEILIAIACDGAGSADRSDVGSTLAANTLHHLIADFLRQGGRVSEIEDETVYHWLFVTLNKLKDRAIDDGIQLQAYATTLLATIVGRDHAVFTQIGDGAIAVHDEKCWRHIFWPDNGLYANETTFLTSGDIDTITQISREQTPITDLAVFTDGIENLVLHKAERTVHAPFFEAMTKPLQGENPRGFDKELSSQLDIFLRQPRVCDLTDDDKTLILASRAKDIRAFR